MSEQISEQGTQSEAKNPCGLRGIAFVEFASERPGELAELFYAFGFSRLMRHRSAAVDLFVQHDIRFLLGGTEEGSFAARFREAHGPSICGLGLEVHDAKEAYQVAVERGARPYLPSDRSAGEPAGKVPFDLPAVYGIGDSLIYFVEQPERWVQGELAMHPEPVRMPPRGFLTIDHLTNNVHKGTLETWSTFYKEIFGFTEVRSFDIRGEQTGLFSYALRSPDGSFCIPINEGKEDKSQIEEYLREYKGPGIQHLAFLTRDLLGSLDAMKGGPIRFLDIDEGYYEEAFQRVPDVREDRERIRGHQVLVDGDEEGYLLQIFTQNLVGPIFIELIQRENHLSFGEGNFGALFRSIERDQARRGVL